MHRKRLTIDSQRKENLDALPLRAGRVCYLIECFQAALYLKQGK
jgi:hypothetical protein